MDKNELYIKFYGKICFADIRQLSCNFNYAIIKGETLSIQAFGSLGMREYSDIDLLIDKSQVSVAKRMLEECGYCSNIKDRFSHVLALKYSHQIGCFNKIINGIVLCVDLNYDVFWGEYKGKRIDIDDFLSDTIEMDIYGVKVKTLPPLKAMIQLILHHYKDMNSIFLLATRKSIKYYSGSVVKTKFQG